MISPTKITFTKSQMFRIIYGAMRDNNTPRPTALLIALRECKAVSVEVTPEGTTHA